MRSGLMSCRRRLSLRRAVVGLLAIALIAVFAPAAGADTTSQIAVQEKRLKWLEGVARQKQARVASIQASMRSLTAQIRESNAELDRLDRRWKRHQDQLIDTMAAYDRLRGQMDTASIEMYMRGPTHYVGAVMGAETLSDVGDAVNYTGALLSRNRRLAEQTALATHEITALREQDEAMIAQ
ncbi:MAG TPA: hypothetical protein VM841_02865, partial [Actinomycetota bacterium]|nr:hypothetical protein [Actinomycetota bacterium]